VIDGNLSLLKGPDSSQFSDLTDFWIVSNPTFFHHQTVEAIESIQANAKILVEKPICMPSEINSSRSLMKTTLCTIRISDVYGQSGLLDMLCELIQNKKIASIRIDFSKNRLEDERSGRTIDSEYGIVGYEWFHMLSILQQIITPQSFDDYLNSKESYFNPNGYIDDDFRCMTLSEITLLDNRVKIELFSSINGQIRSSDRRDLSCLGLHSEVQEMITLGHIPVGNSFNFRCIEIEAADGETFYLYYEPFFGVYEDYKNIHLIIKNDSNGKLIERHEIHYNQLMQFLRTCLNTNPINDGFEIQKYYNISNRLTYARDCVVRKWGYI
jgi:hypothetical protein